MIRLLRILSFLDSRSNEMFDRELAAIKAEEAATSGQGSTAISEPGSAAVPHVLGGSGGDVASADGVISRQAPVDQL